MPWKVKTTLEQKIEFICEWRTGKYSITELCRSFEISRPTAYRLIDRFEKLGFEGLKDILIIHPKYCRMRPQTQSQTQALGSQENPNFVV